MAHLSQDMGENGLGVEVGIDLADWCREVRNGASKALPNGVLIGFRTTFNSVSGALHTIFGGLSGDIQKQGQVGHEPGCGGMPDPPDFGTINTTCNALINQGREQESIGDDARAGLKCGHDLFGQKLGSAGHEHQHFGPGAAFDAVAIKQKASEPIAQGGSTRVAHGQHLQAIAAQLLAKPGGLCRFSGTVRAIKAEE